MQNILEFQGEHRWLSNFWPARVAFEGVIYPSVENAYQAAKTHKQFRSPFVACTPGQAKRLGRNVEIRSTWEAEKLDVMRTLTERKFAAGSELANKLKLTGDCLIVEGNSWGDVFWGQCNGVGLNHLGKIIMDRRAILQVFDL